MNAFLEIGQTRVEVFAVFAPGHLIHAGGRILPEALVRLAQQRHLQQRQ
jgi:hypothetical protein